MPPPAEGLASRLFLAPALRTQPDHRLVALVREGYESAFEEIVRRYGRPLGRYAASIVGGRSEDVLQDAFAKALPALCRDDAEIDLRPWLFRIVRNTALNELRDNPPSPELLAAALAGGGDPSEELERREQLADLIRRLQALPERQRAAIVMRELEGLGHAEIAAALGLSGGAARQAIHRARQALRDGAGMLVPLPLLKALLGGAGPATGEAAAGIGGGAAGAGAGAALKATTATMLVAGAVGAGVALHHGPRDGASAVPQSAAASSATDHAARHLQLLAADRQRGAAAGTSEHRGGHDAGGRSRVAASGGELSPGDAGPGRSRPSRNAGSGQHPSDSAGRDGGGSDGGGRLGPGGDRPAQEESPHHDGGSRLDEGSATESHESSTSEDLASPDTGDSSGSGEGSSGDSPESGGDEPGSSDGEPDGGSGGGDGALGETSSSSSGSGDSRDSVDGGGFSLPTDP
jgi:RNA polymerase sigma factor (sigma-70 family)